MLGTIILRYLGVLLEVAALEPASEIRHSPTSRYQQDQMELAQGLSGFLRGLG